MNFNTAYIISYFGNPSVRGKRKSFHEKQVEWLLTQGFQIVVLANQYEPGDHLTTPGITYINSQSLVSPGESRNTLLKRFYASDDDWALFADNDAILYDDKQHGIGATFKASLTQALFDPGASHLDLVAPINPAAAPITAKIAAAGNTIVFEKASTLKGSMFVLRNLQKDYGKPIYMSAAYNTSATGGILGGEDGHFILEMIEAGYGTYNCVNMVLHELDAKANYSTWSPSMEHRKTQKQAMHRAWFNAFKNSGMTLKPDGAVDRKSFLAQRWSSPNKVII